MSNQTEQGQCHGKEKCQGGEHGGHSHGGEHHGHGHSHVEHHGHGNGHGGEHHGHGHSHGEHHGHGNGHAGEHDCHGHSHGGHGHSHGGHGHSHDGGHGHSHGERHGDAPEGHECMSNPLGYLKMCYAPRENGKLSDNVQRMLELLVKGDAAAQIKKVQSEKSAQGPKTALDLGCGPCVHMAACLSKYYDQIYLAEFLEKSRKLVTDFLDGKPLDFDWNVYFKIIAELEGNAGGADAVKQRLCKSVQKVMPCDVTKPFANLPKDQGIPEKFDTLICNGVLLAVAANNEAQFSSCLEHMAAMMKPGGLLLYGDLADQGDLSHMNYVPLSKEKIVANMEKAGFHHVSWHVFPASKDTWEPDEFMAVFRFCREKSATSKNGTTAKATETTEEQNGEEFESGGCMNGPLEMLQHCYGFEESGKLISTNVQCTLESLTSGKIAQVLQETFGSQPRKSPKSKKCQNNDSRSLLDLCCGPTIYVAACMSRFFDKIVMIEKETENRQMVMDYLAGKDIGFDWKPYFDLIAKLEGTPSTSKAVEKRLHANVHKVLDSCDLAVPSGALPVDGSVPEKFDMIVGITGLAAVEKKHPPPIVCIGAVLDGTSDGLNKLDKCLENLRGMLKPGGFLLLGEMAENFGEEKRCYEKLQRQDVLKHFEKAGFHNVDWFDQPGNPETYEPREYLALFQTNTEVPKKKCKS